MRKIKINPDAKIVWYYKIVLVVFMLLILYCVVCVVHASSYKDKVYTCRHMSRDIERDLERLGLDVQLVTGADNNFARHMWVRILGVDFDSVTLVPVLPALHFNKGVKVYDCYEDYCRYKGIEV